MMIIVDCLLGQRGSSYLMYQGDSGFKAVPSVSKNLDYKINRPYFCSCSISLSTVTLCPRMYKDAMISLHWTSSPNGAPAK